MNIEPGRAGVCRVDGPPTIVWYDGDRNELDVPFETSSFCKPGGNSYGAPCTWDESVLLLDHGPIGFTPGVSAVVVVFDDDEGEDCRPGAVTAAAIGFRFNDGEAEARIDLEDEIEIKRCGRQVLLQDYRPGGFDLAFEIATPFVWPTLAPTPSPLEISWDDSLEFLQACEVRKVTQADSLEIWMVLDDGTEVHAYETRINEVFEEIAKLKPECKPSVFATR